MKGLDRPRDGREVGGDCEDWPGPGAVLPATLANILRSRAVWVTLVAHVVHNYGWWMV